MSPIFRASRILALAFIASDATAQSLHTLRNRSGLGMAVSPDDSDAAIRILLPGQDSTDRSIHVLFPEHVTVTRGEAAEQLYLFYPGVRGQRPAWRQTDSSFEYERDFPSADTRMLARATVHMLARATLENDGVRFHYEFTNHSTTDYDMVYAVTDPRLTSIFHDVRLERTYVHHAEGFDLLASETPERLTEPLFWWLPARYLVSFVWPVPPAAKRVDRRSDGITYYNKSRAVDEPFIATLSGDRRWVVASFTRSVGNVWSNPELTCQHVDPQLPLPAGQRTTFELKILVLEGSLDEALWHAREQRPGLR